ncbi:MAG: hypothetical protein HYX28_08390 [Candidatus Koribacter versatilis]|uniref:DUF3185 domain-containing protein n=1 Tax=Candidatus Korobacter versatilis TaxID=658062 RepID=A0A932A8S3_9BACT|nr:hypothetical protein [Candidatus Koribacter versatilis]
MKALFVIGIVLVVLGVLSLFVPIPQNEKHGMEAGGVKMSVQTRTDEKVPPLISAALIVGGAVMAVAGSRGGKA